MGIRKKGRDKGERILKGKQEQTSAVGVRGKYQVWVPGMGGGQYAWVKRIWTGEGVYPDVTHGICRECGRKRGRVWKGIWLGGGWGTASRSRGLAPCNI